MRPFCTFAIVALVLVASACSSPTGSNGRSGIQIVSPAPAADTIGARLSQHLIVEVRDSAGALIPGVSVVFQAEYADVGGISRPTLLLEHPSMSVPRMTITATTDGAGRAAVAVQLGGVSGTVSLGITVPTFGFAAEAPFTVLPGTTVNMTVLPADTAVTVGGSYALRAGMRDRMGNLTQTAAPTYSSNSTAASVSGVSVAGNLPGRATFTATAGALSTTFSVSVVPTGTLLATASDGVYLFDLDGSGFRRVIEHQGARSVRWKHDGQSFLYSVGLSSAYVGTPDGGRRRLIPDGSPFQAELWVHPSRDGAWVYFGGYSGPEFRGHPYRVRPDGSALQLIPGYTPSPTVDEGHPSPSPDGNRIVFFRGGSGSEILRVLDMTSGEYIVDRVNGHAPAWSHGDSIAYLDTRGATSGPLMLMDSRDGSRRVLSPTRYGFGIDWSPDDRWIVGRNAVIGRLELIEVATGLQLPLPFTNGLSDPTWRP
jgi:hypothetical protein